MRARGTRFDQLILAIFVALFMTHCSKSGGGSSGGGGGGGSDDDPCSDAGTFTEEAVENGEDGSASLFLQANCGESYGDNGGEIQDAAGSSGFQDEEDDEEPGEEIDIPSNILAGLQDGHGCLQGIVTNGFTGQPVDLTDRLEDPSGLFVLIRNEKLKAQIIPDDPNLVGQYFICGIPVEETYPVFAFLDGFYSFESTVNIEATRAGSTVEGNVKAEVAKEDPISRTNIVVFPTDSGGRDLIVRVYHEGAPVSGAIVDVEPLSGADHFAFEGTFASSADTRLFPQRGTTGDDGRAIFPADQMALGHRYRVKVTTADSEDYTSPAAKEITFGISGTVEDVDNNNYTLNFIAADANEALAIISCSPEGETYDQQGSIQIVFNRDIELIDPNKWEAVLGGAGIAASLAADDETAAGSETVSASLVGGNTLFVRPKWDGGVEPKVPDYTKLIDDPQNDDVNLTVSYKADEAKVTVKGDNSENAVALSTIMGAAKCRGASADNNRFTIRFFREYN